MGRPKANLPFGNETLLERVVRLIAPHLVARASTRGARRDSS